MREEGRRVSRVSSVAGQILPGARELRPLGVGLLAERGEPRVERPGLGGVARQLGGPGGPEQAPEAIRLGRQRGLELLGRRSGLTELQQEIAQQLARCSSARSSA
jgi:hypothetical protein